MKEDKDTIETAVSAEPILGQPETAYDMINKYGTYEIQPTADTDNEFPTIAQGLAKSEKNKPLSARKHTENRRK